MNEEPLNPPIANALALMLLAGSTEELPDLDDDASAEAFGAVLPIESQEPDTFSVRLIGDADHDGQQLQDAVERVRLVGQRAWTSTVAAFAIATELWVDRVRADLGDEVAEAIQASGRAALADVRSRDEA